MEQQARNFSPVFEPETVAEINRAYAGALAALGGTAVGSETRVAVAKYMMDLAKAGETDEYRLRNAALSMWRQNSGKAGRYTGL